MATFVKMNRTDTTVELFAHPHEFTLLALIASRCRRTASKIMDLEPNQCVVGDHASCGLSRQQYRTALKKLEKWNFLTIKPTTKGSVITLVNSEVFDINCEEPTINLTNDQPSTNHHLTINQPSPNHQPTTNKNIKNDKKEKKGKNEKEDEESSTTITRAHARVYMDIDLQPGLDAGLTEEQCRELVKYRKMVKKHPLTNRSYGPLCKRIVRVAGECDITVEEAFNIMQGADRSGQPWDSIQSDWVRNVLNERKEEKRKQEMASMSFKEWEEQLMKSIAEQNEEN